MFVNNIITKKTFELFIIHQKHKNEITKFPILCTQQNDLHCVPRQTILTMKRVGHIISLHVNPGFSTFRICDV